MKSFKIEKEQKTGGCKYAQFYTREAQEEEYTRGMSYPLLDGSFIDYRVISAIKGYLRDLYVWEE